jgi:hypothetical protein
MGFALSAIISVPVGLAVTTLLPLFALPREQAGLRRAVNVVSAAVVVGAAATALLMPAYSEARPQLLNLYYVAGAGGGQARYVSMPHNDATPQPLRRHFQDVAAAVLPWSERQYLVAPAEDGIAEGPGLQILSDGQLGQTRTVQLLLRSPRGAASVEFRVPLGRVASISAGGQSLAVDTAGAAGRYYTLRCYGPTCDGLEISLELVGSEPVSALVSDSSPGLPAGGQNLLRDRPATAVPYQEGDLTVIWRRVEL